MEVRSVRSMLEEVLSNWERYGSTVASLQAWLEDAEEALNQPEKVKQVCLFFLYMCDEVKDALKDGDSVLAVGNQIYTSSVIVFKVESH